MLKYLCSPLLVFIFLSVPASAQSLRCRIMDPTGTPLNLRDAPYGQIVGKLPNGMLVRRGRQTVDRNERPWVFVHNFETDEPMGWVFREYVACF